MAESKGRKAKVYFEKAGKRVACPSTKRMCRRGVVPAVVNTEPKAKK